MRSIGRIDESSCYPACSNAAAVAVASPLWVKTATVVPPIVTKEPARTVRRISRQEIEARVLAGLKDRLMAPELVREFIRAFHEEVNRVAAELEQRIKSDALELQSLERKIAEHRGGHRGGEVQPRPR